MHLRTSLIFDGDERTSMSFSGPLLLLVFLLLYLGHRGGGDFTSLSLIYKLSIDLANDD